MLALNSQQLDIRDAAKLRETYASFRPAVVINATAYTAVDKAEAEPELAMAINHQGVLNLIEATASAMPFAASVQPAALAEARNARAPDTAPTRLIHVSTDFVFDGTATRPYRVDDAVNPLGSYGRSKLAGEQALLQFAPQRSSIIRTAWLYADEGKNFVNTMLNLMATRTELKVVDDQRGTPTSVRGLARAIWRFVAKPLTGVYHWTDAGEASWYEFAAEIQQLALQHGLLERTIPILPITTADFPTPARRPAYSVLDKHSTWAALGIEGSPWQVELNKVLALKAAQHVRANINAKLHKPA